jgi:hypothetical protein
MSEEYTIHGKVIQAILSELTLEEKASLCSGKDLWRL